MTNILKTERLKTDILIIGGGTAGCYAAVTIAEHSDAKVLICEKAHIKRSGCLAAGGNALNAYITEGRVPQDYVDYAKKDADGIVREDLLLTPKEMETVYALRKALNNLPVADVTENIISQMVQTKNNAEFLDKIDLYLRRFK